MRVLFAAEATEGDLEELLRARELVVGIGEGELRGRAAAALLFSDFAVMRDGATLHLDEAPVWAGVAWRLGRGAMKLLGSESVTASEAIALGLADGSDFGIGNRSTVALDVTATLLRCRGGDALERATFAWIFATGEPQEGLAAFLGKRPPHFRNGYVSR